MRIGHGYDVHKLVEGRDLIIGGVKIPYEKGLLGHSDADVLLHAVSDSLLGACALGDIGGMFPDNDPQFLDADSLVLLRKVFERIRDNGYKVINVDATVIAQRPKMKPYIPEMRMNIAAAQSTTSALRQLPRRKWASRAGEKEFPLTASALLIKYNLCVIIIKK